MQPERVLSRDRVLADGGASTRWGASLLAAAFTAAFFLVATVSTFQYDDLHSIVANPHIRDLRNLPGFFTGSDMFSDNAWAGMYRPLVLVFHALNWVVGGGDPAPFRTFNAAVHGLNSGAVVLVLASLGMSPALAFFGGVAFGLLPVNAEVAYYFSSRSESLCAFFAMLAFVAYVRGRRGSAPRRRWQVASVACFGLSLLSKEVGIVLPALLIARELTCGAGREVPVATVRSLWRRQWFFWLIAAAYLVGMRGHLATATISEPVRGFGTQFATQVKAWVYYLHLLWHPAALSVEHQFRLASAWAQMLPVIAAAALLLSLFWVVGRLHRHRAVLFLACWAALSLLPTSVVPLNVLVNEHRLYLTAVAFAGFLAWAMGDLLRRRGRVGFAVPLALIAIYGVLSARRSAAWADPGLLWSEAAARAPLMPRPHLFLGDYYLAQGQYLQAMKEYALAESVYPEVLSGGDRLQLHNNSGAALLAMGRFREAREEYLKALRFDSTYAPSREALEGLLAVTGAERDGVAQTLHRRGLAAMVGGRLSEAVDLFRQSLELQSWAETWLSLGMALERLGRTAEARSAYQGLALAGRGTSFEATARARLEALGGRR